MSQDTYTKEEVQLLIDNVALDACAVLVEHSGEKIFPAIIKEVRNVMLERRPK